jgi:hypothetical protein
MNTKTVLLALLIICSSLRITALHPDHHETAKQMTPLQSILFSPYLRGYISAACLARCIHCARGNHEDPVPGVLTGICSFTLATALIEIVKSK